MTLVKFLYFLGVFSLTLSIAVFFVVALYIYQLGSLAFTPDYFAQQVLQMLYVFGAFASSAVILAIARIVEVLNRLLVIESARS